MSAAGRWFITPHAVQRFRERVRSCTYEEALATLVEWSTVATAVKVPEQHDQIVYFRGPNYRLDDGKKRRGRRLRVSYSGDRMPQLLTVI